MSLAEGMVFAIGALIATGTLLLAVQTVVVPRAERSLVVRFVYVGMGLLFAAFARRRKSYEAKDALLARYAPTTLMILPLVWASGVVYGFSLMFWALDVRPYREALVLSGALQAASSLSTSRRDAGRRMSVGHSRPGGQ